MVKVRLMRLGKKNAPFYRVIAIDESKKVGGAPLAILGTYEPKKKIADIDKKAVEAWVKKGAQVSDTVKKLIS